MSIASKSKLLGRNLLWCLSISWIVGFVSIGFKWQLPQAFVSVASWAVPSIALIGRSIPDPEVWGCMATLQWLTFPVYLWIWFSVLPMRKFSPEFLADIKKRVLPLGMRRYLFPFLGIIFFGLNVMSDFKLIHFGWPTFTNGGFVGSPNELTAVLGVVYRSTTMRVIITGASPFLESFSWVMFPYFILHFRTFMHLEIE